jgi:hypothetical protein
VVLKKIYIETKFSEVHNKCVYVSLTVDVSTVIMLTVQMCSCACSVM